MNIVDNYYARCDSVRVVRPMQQACETANRKR